MMKEFKKKRQWIIALGVILFCGGILIFIINGSYGQKAVMGSKSGVSEEEIKEALEKKVDKNLEKRSYKCTANIIGYEEGKEKKTVYMSMIISVAE